MTQITLALCTTRTYVLENFKDTSTKCILIRLWFTEVDFCDVPNVKIHHGSAAIGNGLWVIEWSRDR